MLGWEGQAPPGRTKDMGQFPWFCPRVQGRKRRDSQGCPPNIMMMIAPWVLGRQQVLPSVSFIPLNPLNPMGQGVFQAHSPDTH